MKRNETTKEVNGFTFVNSHGATREGFYHKSILYKDGKEIAKAKVNYINRTWEVYPYQTSMMKAVRQCMETVEDTCEGWYKADCQIKRMTKKHQEEFKSLLEARPEYKELKALYEAL